MSARRPALALLAGVLTTGAFAPFHVWPLAMAGPALLLWLIHEARPRQALWLGWLFGVAHYLSGVWWVVVSTHGFGGAPLWLSLLMLLLLAAYLALYPALAALLLRLIALPGWGGPLLLWPALWLLSSFAATLFLDGFPWFSLGYAAADLGLLRKLAPLLGVEGLSALFALGAGVLVCLARPGQRAPALILAGLVSLALLLLPPVSHWTREQGEPLQVALVQGNVPQDQKWRPRNRLPIMQMYRDLSAQAWPADLVIWPEVAIPAPLDLAEELFRDQDEAALAAGGSLFFTILTYADGRPYNTVYALGRGQGRYVKRHLVPFGEYVPTPDWMRPAFSLLNLPLPDIATGLPGDDLLLVDGHAVSMSICFEDVFPLEVTETARRSEFLVNVTNDAWFSGTAAPVQHLQIARLRAAESARGLLRVANTGISAIIGPDGAVTQRLDWGVRGILRGEVQPRVGETPFQRWGHWPHSLFVVLVLLGALWRRRGLLT